MTDTHKIIGLIVGREEKATSNGGTLIIIEMNDYANGGRRKISTFTPDIVKGLLAGDHAVAEYTITTKAGEKGVKSYSNLISIKKLADKAEADVYVAQERVLHPNTTAVPGGVPSAERMSDADRQLSIEIGQALNLAMEATLKGQNFFVGQTASVNDAYKNNAVRVFFLNRAVRAEIEKELKGLDKTGDME